MELKEEKERRVLEPYFRPTSPRPPIVYSSPTPSVETPETFPIGEVEREEEKEEEEGEELRKDMGKVWGKGDRGMEDGETMDRKEEDLIEVKDLDERYMQKEEEEEETLNTEIDLEKEFPNVFHPKIEVTEIGNRVLAGIRDRMRSLVSFIAFQHMFTSVLYVHLSPFF